MAGRGGIIGKTWLKSKAKKDGVEAEISKYNGERGGFYLHKFTLIQGNMPARGNIIMEGIGIFVLTLSEMRQGMVSS